MGNTSHHVKHPSSSIRPNLVSATATCHRLLIKNSPESLAISLRLLRLQPSLLVQKHATWSPFNGENTLHVVIVNAQEELLIEMISLATAHLTRPQLEDLFWSQGMHGGSHVPGLATLYSSLLARHMPTTLTSAPLEPSCGKPAGHSSMTFRSGTTAARPSGTRPALACGAPSRLCWRIHDWETRASRRMRSSISTTSSIRRAR